MTINWPEKFAHKLYEDLQAQRVRCWLVNEKLKRRGKITLVPVTLDDAVESAEQPWAIKLRRSRYAADFSLWQDSDAYQEVFGYLLKELSTEEEPSDCLEEFHLEEFNIKDDLSKATEQINFWNMRQEFRA